MMDNKFKRNVWAILNVVKTEDKNDDDYDDDDYYDMI